MGSLNPEQYCLMIWKVEGAVSAHKDNELMKLDHAVSYDSLIIGDDASCCFRRTYYEGKIAGISKKFWFSLVHFVLVFIPTKKIMWICWH